MPKVVAINLSHTPEELRRLAARGRDANQSRRLLSIAAVLDGMSRADAARIGGMDRQTLRDWVHRFNERGPDGLKDNWRRENPRRLSSAQQAELAQIVETGPGRASTSAGIELMDHEIVVLGMSEEWAGPLAIDHAVMADAIDIEPVRAALQRLGLAARGQLEPAERAQLVALLAKAEPSTTGVLRGFRHTMLDDSDISATRHARAFVAGALAGLVGHAEIFVSGGAEHQGPDGGGPVAVIIDR